MSGIAVYLKDGKCICCHSAEAIIVEWGMGWVVLRDLNKGREAFAGFKEELVDFWVNNDDDTPLYTAGQNKEGGNK